MIKSSFSPNKRKSVLATIMLSIALSGCSNDMSDLRDFVAAEKAAPKPKVAPLPEIKPYETYRYNSAHLKDPFEPLAIVSPAKAVAAATGKPGTGPRPKEGRPREALESYPLDTLRMVGILDQNNVSWALLKSNDGTIHRVKTGNYIGQNHGKILNVSEEKISLMEIVPDGLGGWIERPATLALAGQPDKGK
jgi:type IV pilus assembly protein PilP